MYRPYKYDMPRGWRKEVLWHEKVYDMWRRMWTRVYGDINYFGCLIHPKFLYLSNFIKWLENESRFEEFKTTCHEVRWCIDKDMKSPGNKNYYPEFMSLCTSSENSKEVNKRRDLPKYLQSTKSRKRQGESRMKSILGVSIKDGSLITFDSVNDVRQKGFTPQNVVKCLKGITSHHKGYKWYYLKIIKL